MPDRRRRILRITFAVVGSITGLLFVVTEVGCLLLRIIYNPQTNLSYAVRSGFIYFGIAVVSFFAVWRLRIPPGKAPSCPVRT
jgi:hypothetical protein